ELVAAAEHAPVDVPRVEPGDVLAVLGELDGEPLVRAAVHAGEVPFDDLLGGQRQVLQAAERLGVQVLVRRGARHALLQNERSQSNTKEHGSDQEQESDKARVARCFFLTRVLPCYSVALNGVLTCNLPAAARRRPARARGRSCPTSSPRPRRGSWS